MVVTLKSPDGTEVNRIVIESLELAQTLFPDMICEVEASASTVEL